MNTKTHKYSVSTDIAVAADVDTKQGDKTKQQFQYLMMKMKVIFKCSLTKDQSQPLARITKLLYLLYYLSLV